MFIRRNGTVESIENPALFPQPQEMQRKIGEYVFNAASSIVVEDKTCQELALLLQEQLKAWIGRELPIEQGKTIASQSCIFLGLTNEPSKSEGYELLISGQGVSIIGNDRSGVIYGCQTLLQLCYVNNNNESALPYVEIRDWPNSQRRGVHFYLPPRESIPGFKRILQTLAHLKMNTLFIEVGAGMEYEKYPEINTTWEKFCKEVMAYPGGPQGVQRSADYWKDSIHPELCRGSYLTKAEVRDIVQYAKHLGFFVIPEIQALSHSYYLTLPFREIAERPWEPYPDTFCPSNPRSYEIYFDVAEEVLEVFEPEWVSIGHDEIRILGECPRCKDKTGEELLAGEINKLYDFYNAKGIKIIMWAEKLQNLITFDGKAKGGVFEEKIDQFGRHYKLPATYKAIDMIPRDIIMLDWYHKLAHNTEAEFYEKGFKEIMYGNLHGSLFDNWEIRSTRDGVLGGEVSTWCVAEEFEIAINNEMYEFLYSAELLWRGGNEKPVWEDKDRQTVEWLPVARALLQNVEYTTLTGNEAGYKQLYSGVNSSAEQAGVPIQSVQWPQGNRASEAFQGTDGLTAIPTIIGDLGVEVDANLKSIVFTHAAADVERIKRWIPSWSFKDMSAYILGHYYPIYEDGTYDIIQIHYGINIGNIGMDWGRELAVGNAVGYEVEQSGTEVSGHTKTASPYYKWSEEWRGSLLYFTIPVRLETEQGLQTAYVYEWVNPRPDKKIESLRFVPNPSRGTQSMHVFGIAGALV